MAVEYIIHFECNAKRALGNGDFLKGTKRMLELLKARDRAAALRQIATRNGKSPAGLSVVVSSVHPNGTTSETRVSYEELVAQASALRTYESECSECHANFLSRSFGCFGVLNFPVPRQSEKWLMRRIQPLTAIGGQLFITAMNEFKFTGEQIKNMRAAGVFESRKPLKKALRTGLFSKVVFTTDQLFEAILGVGEVLEPSHCMCILLWLGAIRLDGIIPTSAAEAEILSKMETVAQRTQHTTLDLGPKANDPAILAMHSLLRALYTSWTQNVPLLIS